MAILSDVAQKVAIWWQKSLEIAGKSGKNLRNSVPKRGKIGKYKEETFYPVGATKKLRSILSP